MVGVGRSLEAVGRGVGQLLGRETRRGETMLVLLVGAEDRAGQEQETYEGPSSWMLRLASHWPMSMLSARDLPCTIPAQKPPAKASLGTQSAQKLL